MLGEFGKSQDALACKDIEPGELSYGDPGRFSEEAPPRLTVIFFVSFFMSFPFFVLDSCCPTPGDMSLFSSPAFLFADDYVFLRGYLF